MESSVKGRGQQGVHAKGVRIELRCVFEPCCVHRAVIWQGSRAIARRSGPKIDALQVYLRPVRRICFPERTSRCTEALLDLRRTLICGECRSWRILEPAKTVDSLQSSTRFRPVIVVRAQPTVDFRRLELVPDLLLRGRKEDHHVRVVFSRPKNLFQECGIQTAFT